MYIKTLITILFLSVLALPVDRPYMHIAIYARDCRADWCSKPYKMMYDVPTLNEAMKKFQAEKPEAEMLCVARDFFARCQTLQF